jgi:hypothetical protein
VPLLYEGIDEESANEIQKLDDEIQAIKRSLLQKFPSLDLSQVMPMKERICTMYKGQVGDETNLFTVFKTNKGYRRVPFPMIPVEGQDLKNTPESEQLVKLNLNARFFWEDMPYGLCILKNIGDLVGVPTPNVTRVLLYHQQYMPVKYLDEKTGKFNEEVLTQKTGAPAAYGIRTAEELVKTSLGKSVSHNIFFR